MAYYSFDYSHTLDELVAFLFNRRETPLNNWRTACEKDPSLKKISALSREEFNNIVPIILDNLEQLLLGKKLDVNLAVAAQSHGLQRWQKSLDLPDLLTELSHLSVILFDELKLFRQLFPQSEPDAILQVQQQVLVFMHETMRGSITKHDELQRLEVFHKQLKPVVEETSTLAPDAAQPVAPLPNDEHRVPENPLEEAPPGASTDKGEGVGLQIVKRLCESIGASMEIESAAGRRTLFRIRMLIQPPS